MRQPATRTITIYQGADFLLPLRVLVTNLDGTRDLLDTSDYSARFTVRQTDWDGAVMVDASTDNGRIVAGYTPGIWQATTTYALGQRVIPMTGPNGFLYECTTAGDSDSGEPSWPTQIGQSVSDDSAAWTCIAPDATLVNLYLHLTDTVTAGLTDWGRGVYTLELEDLTGHTARLMNGLAYLSREAAY